MKLKRILMTGDAVGGVWTYAMDLIQELEFHDVEVLYASMGSSMTEAQQVYARSIGNLRVEEKPFKLEWMDRPWDDIKKSGEWLLDLEDEFKPDVVHLNAYAHAALPWRAPKLVVAHSCIASWWEAVKGTEVPAEYQVYQEAIRRGLEAADWIVAPTRSMLLSLLKHYRHPEAGMTVVYNGRNNILYHAGSKDPLILSAGRIWNEAKNMDLLLQAASRLPFPVYIAGEMHGPEGRKISPSPNIEFLGRLNPEELATWFSRASVYVQPAKYEPFGLSILEAALSGCALILGDIPSLREIWKDSALYVSSDDPQALEEAIGKVMNDAAFRESLVALSKEYATHFTADRMAKGYLRIYEKLLLNAQALVSKEKGSDDEMSGICTL